MMSRRVIIGSLALIMWAGAGCAAQVTLGTAETASVRVPSGTGPLIPSGVDVDEFNAKLKELGFTPEYLYTQDELFKDVGTDVPFVQAGELVQIGENPVQSKPESITPSAGFVVADGVLVIQFLGSTCARLTGVKVESSETGILVELQGGEVGYKEGEAPCLDRLDTYRLTVLDPLASSGLNVLNRDKKVDEKVTPPLLEDLSRVAIPVADLPAF